ncbi:MAG: riboflavin biosynthesis protein RibD [Desulfobulbus propionicus]|nr:MAG: riboflavin biosynthesis protein RibD [Desulfobulbus propionicus]
MSGASHDERFMELALAEARKGAGRTSPNPLVGAVIVCDDQVVARGYHHRAGSAHAEINALAEAGPAAVGATLYVTLEPCNHTGRTPPCSEAIITSGIRRVVFGLRDPNPLAGGGVERLRQAGLDVHGPVLESRCRELNFPFLKHVATGLPWVIMKAGMSLDGRISYRQGSGGAITGPAAHERVHQIRDVADALLVGRGTVAADNPSLTTRLPGGAGGRDPLRVILDTRLRLSPEARLLHQESSAPTWVFCGEAAPAERAAALSAQGAVVHRVATSANGLDLGAVFRKLGSAGIQSVLVEGGAAVHGAMLREGLVDQAMLFLAPFFIGEAGTPLIRGALSPSPEAVLPALRDVRVEQVGDDLLVTGLIRRP